MGVGLRGINLGALTLQNKISKLKSTTHLENGDAGADDGDGSESGVEEGILEAVRVHSGEDVGQDEHYDNHSHCEEEAGMRPVIMIVKPEFLRSTTCIST